MSLTRVLGETLERGTKSWRVVRICHQLSLCEDQQGVTTVVEEDLVELKSVDGEVDFEVQRTEVTPYEGPTSVVKAPEPLTWKRGE